MKFILKCHTVEPTSKPVFLNPGPQRLLPCMCVSLLQHSWSKPVSWENRRGPDLSQHWMMLSTLWRTDKNCNEIISNQFRQKVNVHRALCGDYQWLFLSKSGSSPSLPHVCVLAESHQQTLNKLWWAGDLSRVSSISHPVTAGIDSSISQRWTGWSRHRKLMDRR